MADLIYKDECYLGSWEPASRFTTSWAAASSKPVYQECLEMEFADAGRYRSELQVELALSYKGRSLKQTLCARFRMLGERLSWRSKP